MVNNNVTPTPPTPTPYVPLTELSPFKMCIIQEFPFIEADFDAITNYQLLCKIVEYLNNVIANTNVQNSNIEIMEGNVNALYRSYSELKTYVDEYFDNLDLQEEVSAKLDAMAEDGFFDEIFEKYGLMYATPQMFGAIGDGVHDDTQAIQTAIYSGKMVFIPKGLYRITSTIYMLSKNATCVHCDMKAYIKADAESFNGNEIINCGFFSGYTINGGYWKGGNLDCSGIENVRGFALHEYSPKFTLENVNVYNVGYKSIGIYITGQTSTETSKSPKFYLNNVYVIGGTLNYALPFTKDSNVTSPTMTFPPVYFDEDVPNYITTGIYVKDCYDFSMGTIYCLGVTKGIVAENSSQIYVSYYHYWAGCDANTTIPLALYKATRGIVLLDAYWQFGEFYPDKPYIAIETTRGIINASNVHYIVPFNDTITHTGEETPCCYLAQMNFDSADGLNLNNVDINNSGDRIVYRGVKVANNSLLPYRRGQANISYAYPQILNSDDNINMSYGIDKSNVSYGVSITSGSATEEKWHTIGYIGVSVGGVIELSLCSYTATTLVGGNCKIIVRPSSALISEAYTYETSNQNYHEYMAIGNVITASDGTKWMPVLFRTTFNVTNPITVRVSVVSGKTVPFMYGTGEYTETVPTSSKVLMKRPSFT